MTQPAAGASINICVIASGQPRQVQEIPLAVPAGTTVEQALQAAGLVLGAVGDGPPFVQAGVWGRKVALTQPLRAGDRVEVYRALTVDPKVARRERFVKQGSRGTGLFSLKARKSL